MMRQHLFRRLFGYRRDRMKAESVSSETNEMQRLDAAELQMCFVRELNGPGAESFKYTVSAMLTQHRHVARAYLVHAVYGAEKVDAAVPAIRFHPGHGLMTYADQATVEEVGRVFRRMFGAQTLDILPVDDAQEQQIRTVCRPFFHRTGFAA